MRLLVVGLGSMGRRHLTNLRRLAPDADITVWRQHARPQDALPAPPEADRVVFRLGDALASRPEAAVVACPTSFHVQTATALAERGVHLLIEKPLSHTLTGVDVLLDVCRGRDLVALVGYVLRFHPPLRVIRQAIMEERIGRVVGVRAEVGQYLPEWRPGTDYRRGVSAREDLGGGAVLELSHELDYVRWLVGEVEAVGAQLARLGNLELDVEDTAEITLRFRNGAVGSVHLDMVQRAPTRSCRVIGTEGTLTWDGSAHQVRVYTASTGAWSDLCPAAEIDRNEMYLAEMRHFLDCVNGKSSPEVPGEEGRRVLEIALAAKQSSREQRVVAV